MIRKMFWSAVVVAMTGAGLVYVVAKHHETTPAEMAQSAVEAGKRLIHKQMDGVGEVKPDASMPTLEEALTPQPVGEEGGELELPPEIVGLSPEEIPPVIDIEREAVPNEPLIYEGPTVDAVDSQPGKPEVMPYCTDEEAPRMPYAEESQGTSLRWDAWKPLVTFLQLGQEELPVPAPLGGSEPSELPGGDANPHQPSFEHFEEQFPGEMAPIRLHKDMPRVETFVPKD